MLNKKAQVAIRCIKSINQTLENSNNDFLALISGLSREYYSRNKKKLEQYYKIAPEATEIEMEEFEKKSLDFYLNVPNSNQKIFIPYLGAVVGYLMKHKYKLLPHIQKPSIIIKTGTDIVNIMKDIKSKKGGSGVRINSRRNNSVRSLFNHNKVSFIDPVFNRSGSYYNGKESKKWSLTQLGETILKEAIEIILGNLKEIIQKKPNFLKNNLDKSHINCDTYSSICSSLYVTLPLTSLSDLCLSSILHVLSLCIGFKPDTKELIISLEHTSSTDENLGRNYNVFTRLRSQERTILGFIGYDMSSAMQSICLQLVGHIDFPLLSQYATNKVYKRYIRAKIANDLGVSVSDVKQKLTAFANGGVSGINEHPFYKEFQKESDLLRRKTLAFVSKNEPDVLERAVKQSKKNLPEDIDWEDLSYEDSQTMARNKASVFFFVWTWYERLIRKAMLKVIPNGIEVHDAVYSKQKISISKIEQAIKNKTGFDIQIERE